MRNWPRLERPGDPSRAREFDHLRLATPGDRLINFFEEKTGCPLDFASGNDYN